nr:hypothetical protein [Acinetobacter sp. Marseille-Q1620]
MNTNLSVEHKIDLILNYIFTFEVSDVKKQQHCHVLAIFEAMDMVEKYQLFYAVQKHLPLRAGFLFASENYQGKIETLLEVIDAIQLKKN